MITTIIFLLFLVTYYFYSKNKVNPQAINFGESVGRREPSYTVAVNINWYILHYGEQYGHSLKNQKSNYHMTQKSHSGHTFRVKHGLKGYMHPYVQRSTNSNNQNMEAV